MEESKKTELDPSWCYPVKGPEVMGHMEIQGFPFKHKEKIFLMVRLVKH